MIAGRLVAPLRRRRRPETVIGRVYPAWLRTHPAQRIEPSSIGVSVLMPIHDAPAAVLQDAIASVRRQHHSGWELCIVDDASTLPHVKIILDDAAAADHRIRVLQSTSRLGIAGASNAALGMATLPFVGFLDHDDRLATHALARMAREIDKSPDLDMIFSDEDQLDTRGHRTSPYFKPGWNRDLLLGQNLVCHFAVYRRNVVLALGGLREMFDGSQDYDLALRVAAVTADSRIRHIPEILYHWRQSQASHSAVSAESCRRSAGRALQDYLGDTAEAVPNAALPQWMDARFPLPAQLDDVVILKGAIEPAAMDWACILAAHLLRDGIGCAGGRIDDRHGRILHAGWILDPQAIAQTLSPGSDADDPGYRGQFCLLRTVSAVSSACMAVRRDVFEQLGGFDERAGIYADIDFCLRLAAIGLRTVWVPQVRVAMRRLPRRDDPRAAAYMRDRWELAHDAFLNPNLVVAGGQLSLKA